MIGNDIQSEDLGGKEEGKASTICAETPGRKGFGYICDMGFG